MYGINAGYDTRPIATGYTDTGVRLFGTEKTVFFQQAAFNAEAVSDTWSFNSYALIPTGDVEQRVNWFTALVHSTLMELMLVTTSPKL